MVWYKGILAASSSLWGDRELCQDVQKLPERTERTNRFENIGNPIDKVLKNRSGRFDRLKPVYLPVVTVLVNLVP